MPEFANKMGPQLSRAEEFLYKLPRFALVGNDAYQPGLDRMDRILDKMGRPEQAFRSIHIAGTNGKGSTAAFIAAIASAAGLKTGLHTSPHLLYVGERMRIDGVPASPSWLDATVPLYTKLFLDTEASFFEVTTALSFLYFAQYDVDLAVVEVGLGGRFDATNILQPELSIITNVALDHEAILGDTIEEIASEKAGIVKARIPILTGATEPDVTRVIRGVSERMGAPLHIVEDEVTIETLSPARVTIRTPEATFENLEIDLPGSHQNWNAATAIRALELCPHLVEAGSYSVRVGLEQVRARSGIRGRTEILQRHPHVILDVAHNAAAMMVSAETSIALTGRLDHVYLGLMKDKRISLFASWLAEYGIPVSTLHLESDRAVNPYDLATLLRKDGVDIEQEGLAVAAALDRFTLEAKSDQVCLFLGSHLIVADALAWELSRPKPE